MAQRRLTVVEDFVRSHNPQTILTVSGQELDSESYAIYRSDMMLKGQNASNIKVGTSLKAYDPDDPGDQLSHNTGIFTCFWIVSNRRAELQGQGEAHRT